MPSPVSRLATLVEEPVRRLGSRLHGRLPANGLRGLDPDVARAVGAAGPVDSSRLPVPLMRAGYRLQTMLWNRPRETAVRVEDERVNDHVTIRTYTPHHDRGGGLVYFHGGGMVIGDLETHDRWCRWMAVRAGVVVHAVDYRLAPEHAFPAGCVDALVAWNHVVAGWQAQGRSLARLGVGGDSAGGYLSAVVGTQMVDPTLGVPAFVAGDNIVETTNTLDGFTFVEGATGVVPGTAESNVDVFDVTGIGSLEPTTFIGAVEGASDDWFLGWTIDLAGNETTAN